MSNIMENESNLVYDLSFYDRSEADAIFNDLLKLPFIRPIFEIKGKKVSPQRKLYSMGDPDTFVEFSGLYLPGNEWSPSVLKLKTDLERKLNTSFNFAILDYFMNGLSKITPHYEKDETPTATLSFGEKRLMLFQRKGYPDIKVDLCHGSLLVKYRPTSQLFTQAVVENPTIEMPTITVTFKNISPPEQPSKKIKLDTQSDNVMETTGIQFSSSCYLLIKEFHSKFYVDMRHHHFVNFNLLPSKNGIMLSSEDWYNFYNKLYDFNFIQQNANQMTTNLMMMNIDDKLHLQQISVTQDKLSFHKSTQLSHFEVRELLEKMHEINSTILECLWTDYLPRQYSKNVDEEQLMSCEIEAMQKEFYTVLEVHFGSIIRKYYRCLGCLMCTNDQLSHSCMNTPIRVQFETLPNILLCVNIHELINELIEKRLFTKTFINSITVQELEKNLYV